MDIQERISVLTQGAEIAQRNGILTLDEAYTAKQAIDVLKSGNYLRAAFDVLLKIAISGQKKGIYTLRDAHTLYLASENLDAAIPRPAPQPAPQPVVQEPASTTATPVEKKTRTKKES